jgi:hypothetical protein
MTSGIEQLAKDVLSAGRKGLFRSKPLFKLYASVSTGELAEVEQVIGNSLPVDLRDWLTLLGYGDLDEVLSFRKEWFANIQTGPLKGSAIFAQDILGNFYAFDSSDQIYFLSRSEAVFVMISKNFLEFIEEVVRRDYKLIEWVSALKGQKYGQV